MRELTGMKGPLAPMAGAQGEFAGVRDRAYHEAKGDIREVIVPSAAHGTTATAVMCK